MPSEGTSDFELEKMDLAAARAERPPAAVLGFELIVVALKSFLFAQMMGLYANRHKERSYLRSSTKLWYATYVL